MHAGLFHFDASFRPVPLEMQFIGVTETNFTARNTRMIEICYDKTNFTARNTRMIEICYDKVVDSLKRGYQCMVFVHSRKDTGKTARALADMAGGNADSALFDTRDNDKYHLVARDVKSPEPSVSAAAPPLLSGFAGPPMAPSPKGLLTLPSAPRPPSSALATDGDVAPSGSLGSRI
eukprot:gene4884-34649_t